MLQTNPHAVKTVTHLVRVPLEKKEKEGGVGEIVNTSSDFPLAHAPIGVGLSPITMNVS